MIDSRIGIIATIWARFGHNPEKTYTNFDEVCREIENDTNKVCGTEKEISEEEITLEIFSPSVVNLTLIDLPGITQVRVGKQAEDIVKQIRNLVLKYITNPNSKILAVTQANIHIANSDAIKIAMEVDPEGERTLGVLTKLDLMDRGTDAIDLLQNKGEVKLRHGFIGVVNRSQRDIDERLPIEEQRKRETKFLNTRYLTIANRNGTAFLADTLHTMLMLHIKECLPGLLERINDLHKKYEYELKICGPAPKNQPDDNLVKVISRFCKAYENCIDGNIETTKELCGGQLISAKIHGAFEAKLREIRPMSDLTSREIQNTILNTRGLRRANSVLVLAFETLVKIDIEKLKTPSIDCTDDVYEQMKQNVHLCGKQTPIVGQEMLRYPNLHKRIGLAVVEMLNERLAKAKEAVELIVDCELNYIDTIDQIFSEMHRDGLKESSNIGHSGGKDKEESTQNSNSLLKSALTAALGQPMGVIVNNVANEAFSHLDASFESQDSAEPSEEDEEEDIKVV
uniref:Dynamin-type G domain-containing protein n=1 Tax=Plectus sambesii TaxID=2011161 RepID=A0A914UHW6_9BILA